LLENLSPPFLVFSLKKHYIEVSMGDASPNIEKRAAQLGKKIGTIISYSEQVEKETGERIPTSEPEILLRANQGQDTENNSLFGQANRAIRTLRELAEKGIALTDGELRPVLDHIEQKFPGRNRETAKELKDYVVKMVFAVQEKIPNASQLFQELEDSTKAEAIRKNDKYADLVAVYEYVSLFGEKTGNFSWKTMLAYAQALQAAQKDGKIDKKILQNLVDQSTLNNQGKKNMYDRLLEREGHSAGEKWKSKEQKEKAFDKLLDLRQPETAVDVQRFLKLRLYDAVAMRLGAMRGPYTAKLEKRVGVGGEELQKMEIVPKKGLKFPKYNCTLVPDVVDEKTAIGKFLDEMGEGAFWRGKAGLDALYWWFTVGQQMSVSADLPETDRDLFRKTRDSVSMNLRKYAGWVANYNMGEDKQFNEAQTVLYQLYPDLIFEERLKILGKNQKFLAQDEQLPEELPDHIADAVMFEKAMVLDAFNMIKGDSRRLDYHPAQEFHLENVTDLAGKVYKFLGEKMRFCEDEMLKLGWFCAQNLAFNYGAMVPDLREFNPKKYWDQKDKIWQHIFMYLLELNDRDWTLKRVIRKKEDRAFINGQPMTAGPGETGEYMNYYNERTYNGEYDHRRGVFKRILSVFTQDKQLIKERGYGKAGWDDVLYKDTHGEDKKTRDAVELFINFCQSDLSRSNAVTICGVTIDKGKNEIFYNDKLAVLLHDYETDPGNAAYSNSRGQLDVLLNMRNVLRDHRCWGFVFDLQDPETRERLKKNQDLTFVEGYGSTQARSILMKLIQADITGDIYEFHTTPAQILEATLEMKQRRHPTQNVFPLLNLLFFAKTAMLRRLTEMEVTSSQDMVKMTSPLGDVKLGAPEEVERRLGIQRDELLASNSIQAQIEAMGYSEYMMKMERELIKLGLPDTLIDYFKSSTGKKNVTESLQWVDVNNGPLDQRLLWEELGSTLRRLRDGTNIPISGSQVLSVVIEDGEIETEEILINHINRIQQHLYFEEMSDDEAGEVFGGSRPITIKITGKEPWRTKPNGRFLGVGADRPKEEVLLRQIYKDEQGEIWYRVADKEGNFIGWINDQNVQEMQFFEPPELLAAKARKGEILEEGGRFYWEKEEVEVEKNGKKVKDMQWGWVWKKGKWIRAEFVDKEGKWLERKEGPDYIFEQDDKFGFNRELKLGTPKSIEDLVKYSEKNPGEKNILFDPKTLKQEYLQEKDEKGYIKPAKYPHLKFKSREHQEHFFFRRYLENFSVYFGRGLTTKESAGSGAEYVGDMHLAKTAGLTQHSELAYWMQSQMRDVVKKICARGQIIAGLEKFFGKTTSADDVIKKRIKTYETIAKGEGWGKDRDQLERFTLELSRLRFWGQKGKDIIEEMIKNPLDYEAYKKAKEAYEKAGWFKKRGMDLKRIFGFLGKKTIEQGIYSADYDLRNWLVKAFIQASQNKTKLFGILPINLPSAVISAPVTIPLILRIPASTAAAVLRFGSGGAIVGWGGLALGGLVSYGLATAGVGIVGGYLASVLEVDIEKTAVDKLGYLYKYDSFVPVE